MRWMNGDAEKEIKGWFNGEIRFNDEDTSVCMKWIYYMDFI